MTRSKEVHLIRRPKGMPVAEDFQIVTVDVPEPGAGEVQVRNTFMSVDPYMRGRMNEAKSYAQPYGLNEVMYGGAIGEVVASNDPGFKPGDTVQSGRAWREVFNAPAAELTKLDVSRIPPQAYLGVAGMPGLTAYAGLLDVGGLKDGDVVFVSAASGAVGAVVAQIAKIKGHKVIGSAGGQEKCDWLKSIGVDEVIDYKAEDNLTKALARAAPEGIDVYFDNVGGAHLDAALAVARPFARFAICGMIAGYNNPENTVVRNMINVVGKSIRIQGFIVTNYAEKHMPAFQKDMADWIGAGQVQWKETVEDGIDNSVDAFLKLFSGGNFGKMLVKLS